MKENIKLKDIAHNSKGLLGEENEVVFHTLEVVLDGIAEAFGSNCEVVLHSLEDVSHSIVKVANGHVTGRKVGAPLTDFGLEILRTADSLEKDVIGSYYSKLEDGRLLKSVTMLVRNARGNLIGQMCINIDLAVPWLDFLRGFLPKDDEPSVKIVEHFPLTLNELINRTLETVMTRVNRQREVSPSEKNKTVVMELYEKGMFDVRGAIDVVAKIMGVSRYTVYNYIREAKVKRGSKK